MKKGQAIDVDWPLSAPTVSQSASMAPTQAASATTAATFDIGLQQG